MSGIFLEALKFAAEKHLSQRRKGCAIVPYINHPIKVVHLLVHIGKETDEALLTAAILHDVLEDTQTMEVELREKFGDRITDIVVEVTDDMSLTYEDRKRKQIQDAPGLSDDAKKIKIADKIANIRDILDLPITWSRDRKYQYVEWSQRVVKECSGINVKLDDTFSEVFQEALQSL